MKKILLFIPIYNCERQITRVFNKITPDLLAYISEIIVVDNRSSDNSCEAATNCLKPLSHTKVSLLQNNANYNLGGSIKVALNYALEHAFDYIIVLHGDDQADPRDILSLLQDETAFSADFYIGARFNSQSRLYGYSPVRVAGNKAFNLLLGLIVHRRIDDLIAGLNLYRVAAFKERWYLCFPDNLTFDAHMLLYALHHKFRIQYFPISWREEDQISNARIFKQGYILLKLFMGYVLRKDVVLAKRDNSTVQAYGSQAIYSHVA